MRIYCGLATDGGGSWAAIVDDTGRPLSVTALADETAPGAFTTLCRLLAAQGGGRCAPIATDDGSGTVPQLCTAAGHPVVVTDNDVITRFTRDDATARDAGARRALAAARALQTGAVTAIASGAVRNMARLRPLLSSAGALAVGRAAAVSALRAVLRDLYPAALRAFDDPGAPLPLAVIGALPEPSAAAYCDDREIAAGLAAAGRAKGDADTAGMVAALRTAAAEYAPARRSTDAAIRATVRAAADAVLTYDEGLDGLAAALAERLSTGAKRRVEQPTPVDLPPVPADAPKRRTIPGQRPQNPSGTPPAAAPTSAPPAAAGPAPAAEGSRSSKITSLPTRRSNRGKADSGAFPTMPEPPVFTEPDGPHTEPETVPLELQRPAPRGGDAGPARPERSPRPERTERRERPAPAQQRGGGRASVPGIEGDDDEGLTIFAQAKSAWFTGVSEDDEPDSLDWSMPTDEAWRSAQKSVTPSTGEQTSKGLPRRVPQANLVPGSAKLPEETGPMPIERDPKLIAANTAGYFRGWNRARRDTVDAAPVGANGSTVR